jgi:chaperonin cofactor prefoldin
MPPMRTLDSNKSTRSAFASIEEKDLFQKQVNAFRSRLRVGSTGDISALGDGAEWIWNIYSEVLGKVRECLDVFHALGHLSETGKALYKEGSEDYKQWQEVTKWELLESGFEKIEKRLDTLEKETQGNDEQESLRKLRGYLENHRERLCYRERLAEGRAIGSGQVEGACKSMIGRRLKQTGARWRVDRLNEMAVLCSVHYSDLWEKYWMQAK